MSVDILQSILLSLKVGLGCTVLGFPLALTFGWLMARKRFPCKSILSAFILGPIVLPPVVTGLLLLDLTGRNTMIGGFFANLGFPLSFSFWAAILAALVVGLPLYIWSARAAFEAVDPRYEEISLTLGVTPTKTFLRVTLPLALPGLIAGLILAFARGLGEFGATAVLAGNIPDETQTIALAVYSLLETENGETAARPLILASIAISVIALIGYELLIRWQRRRLELDRG